MRLFVGFCLLVLSCGAAQAQTTALPDVTDASLVRLISDMEIIAERRDPLDPTYPYFLRIVRVQSEGECGGTPESCPRVSVYISISSRDEYPDRRLYRLPDAYGWELDGWSKLPQRESPEEFVEFEMSRKVVAEDTTRGWWAREIYEIKVNLASGTMRRISPD